MHAHGNLICQIKALSNGCLESVMPFYIFAFLWFCYCKCCINARYHQPLTSIYIIIQVFVYQIFFCVFNIFFCVWYTSSVSKYSLHFSLWEVSYYLLHFLFDNKLFLSLFSHMSPFSFYYLPLCSPKIV